MDFNIISLSKFDPVTAVKGNIGRGAGGFRDEDFDDGRVGEKHGTEGEGVRTNGGDEDCGDGGVDETSACGEGIGC